jgi:sugar phosphate isomerase/epimerase
MTESRPAGEPAGARQAGFAPPAASKLSLNTATVGKQWNLRQMIEACARHEVRGISPWRDKLAELGVGEAARLIRSHGLTVTGLCRGGMFPAADAAGRKAALDDNRRAVDDAATLGAQCLVLVVGGIVPGTRDLPGARQMVMDGIAELLDHARACQVPLAIEPLHPMYCADRACVNTIDQALDICDAVEPRAAGEAPSGAIGVAVDAYHVWWDPNLARAIARIGGERLLGYHICDWLVPTKELLNDRGMMGDGVIDLPALRAMVEGQGYEGLHEVEIFSMHWWRQDPDAVMRTIRERHLRCS